MSVAGKSERVTRIMRRVMYPRERRKTGDINQPEADREDERRRFQTGDLPRIDDKGRGKNYRFHGCLLAAPPAVARE